MLYIRRLTKGHDYHFLAEVSKNEGEGLSILRALIVSYKTHSILRLPQDIRGPGVHFTFHLLKMAWWTCTCRALSKVVFVQFSQPG